MTLMFAICFGHQLMAYFFGGKVERDETQAEGGIISIELLPKGTKTLIFKNIPKKFSAVSGHKDSVVRLPKKAKLLARSQKTKFQSYKIKNNIYCVQFHPELDTDGLVYRMSLFPEYARGRSLEEIKKEFVDMPYAVKTLENFKDLVYNKAQMDS